jgi:hypothetical protein
MILSANKLFKIRRIKFSEQMIEAEINLIRLLFLAKIQIFGYK